MSSPNPAISPVDPAPENNEVSVVARQALNPPTRFFFPHNPSPHRYYFSAPPPIYFFSNNCLPPPPSIWVYNSLWFINPNPNNRYESIQELPPPYTPNPSQELSPPPTSSRRVFGRGGYGRGKKVIWRRRIRHEVESNGVHITTVMLRNIPNRYTYVTAMNKGYAFVNFTNAKAASKFKDACNHKPWSCFYSKKILEITSARIQGKDELVKHFQQMTYPAEAYSAACFSPARTGPENTVQTIMVGKCTEPMSSV